MTAFINTGNYGNGNFYSVNFHGFRKLFPYLSEAIACALEQGKTKFKFRATINQLRDALHTSYILDDNMTEEDYTKYIDIIYTKHA